MLAISNDLQLPIEAVTQTFGIIAKRGVGKTYTASVMAEEMLMNGMQVVILDPIGVWWGLRSSADGQKPGLPIVIFGGDHGDIEVIPESGAKIASILVDERVPAVIDLSAFRKGERKRFVTDFAEELYHSCRHALHLILDEADSFAPQRPMKGEERMLGAMEDIVRRGRARGLGVTLITQRAAVLNKDVLTQVEVLIALRTVAKPDIEAVDAWIKYHSADDARQAFVSSLPSLPVGTAWFWSPGWLDMFQQIKIRPRKTFDSSATPKVGQTRIEPRSLADVNLERLRDLLAPPAAPSKPESKGKDSLVALRLQVQQLQAELQQRHTPEQVIVEVPVISDETVTRLEELANQAVEYGRSLIDFGESALESIQIALNKQRQPMTQAATKQPARVERATAQNGGMSKLLAEANITAFGEDSPPPSGALKILRALARRYPTRLTRPQVGTLSGFSYKGGTFGNYLSILRKRGLIEEAGGDMTVTSAGLLLLGDGLPDAPETTADLIGMWSAALPGGAATMLSFLAENYPSWFDRESLGDATGYTSSGGTFGNYLSILRRNNLIEERGRDVRANTALMTE